MSRGTARFLNETRIIPPLSYATCVDALQRISQTTNSLEIHFADEEGDPYAVELAGKVGGYVAGNDSDFVVLNSDGYRGYIPLNELTWYSSITTISTIEGGSDEEFQTVRKPKTTRRPDNTTVGRGIIPPDTNDQLVLSFNVYNPDTLATHLKIPSTLLPLLGAIIGNDYSVSESSSRNIQSLFFGKQLSSTQRISYVANTLCTILSPTSQKKQKQKHQLDGVMDLIDRSVNALLPRSTILGSGEIEKLMDKIVDATLQYAIPRSRRDDHERNGIWPTDTCALHEPEFCPLLPMFSRAFEIVSTNEDGEGSSDAITIRASYLNAYRRGRLSPKIMDTLNSGTFWPRLFLENPDLETVGRSIGGPLREWVYAVIHDAVGLPYAGVDVLDVQDKGSDHNSDDELIDVVESDGDSGEDLLAPLKGQLQLLHGPEKDSTASSSTALYSQQQPITLTIKEYIRKGTRVAEEVINVRSLHELLSLFTANEAHRKAYALTPLLMWPREDRFTLLLQILGSDVPRMRTLPPEQLTAVLSLRWVIKTMHKRAQAHYSKDRDSERWSRREAHCFLTSFHWSHLPVDKTNPETGFPPIVNRSIQLMAQTLVALESVEHLSQTLLLSEILPSPAYMLSGRDFHRRLADNLTIKEPLTPSLLWEVC